MSRGTAKCKRRTKTEKWVMKLLLGNLEFSLMNFDVNLKMLRRRFGDFF